MQQRRGTAAQWTAANPILAAGEIGFETDTSKFKMGNGSSTWSALTYFANAAELAAIIDGAPDLLNTLNELAASIGDDPNFLTALATNARVDGVVLSGTANLTSALGTHNSSTANVHGIADTTKLATTYYADERRDAAIQAAASDASYKANAAQAAATEEAAADATSKAANAKSEAIAAAQLAIEAEALETATAITNAVSALTKSSVGLSEVDNIADAFKPVSEAQATAIGTAKTEAITAAGQEADTKISTHDLDTLNIHGIADTSLLITQADLSTALSGAVVDQSALAGVGIDWNVTSEAFDVDETYITNATETELNLKAPKASPTFTGTVVLPAVTAGGDIIPVTDNTYSLGSPTKMFKDVYVGPGSLYVNGQKVLQDESGSIVVSADLNENLGLRTSGSGNIELDPTGTGSVNIKGPLVVEAGANFSSADGEGIAFGSGIKSDAITSKTLNTDLSLSGNGTGKVYLNDNAEVNGNLVVGGNLTVSGTTTTVNSETIALADNIIDLNSNFTTGTPTENSGLRIMRGDSPAVQVRWNEATDKWEITNDGTNYSSVAGLESPTFTGTVTIPAGASIAGYAPVASPTFTGAVTVAASGVVFTDGTQTKAGVPSITNIPTAVAAGAVTIGADRADQFVPLNGAVVITLPATGYVTGQSIDFYQASSTGARFESTNGVVGTPGLKFRTTNSVATAMKISSGWLVFGDLSA